ncbi:MAG: hypothetical protein C4293_19110 [Nitrospiraceae bacterium]
MATPLKDISRKVYGILVFNLKGQVLYSNYDGRILYLGERDGTAPSASTDISFDVKRLCFRLKKLADASSIDGSTFEKCRALPIVTSGDPHYRLEGSLIVDEVTNQPHILIKVEKEEFKGPGTLNLAHYQSVYRLTPREIQVVELLSKGASYKEISYSLMISFHTVRDHIKHIRFKLNADGKCGILARLIEEARVYEKASPSEASDPDDPAPLTRPDAPESSAPVLESRRTAADKARLVAAKHAQAPTKPGGFVAPVGNHAPVRNTGSWRPAGKRDLQPKGRSL